MIRMKEMLIEQQNLMDLLLELHRKFKKDPATGNPLDLTGCYLENVTIRDFDFDGVSCNGTHFARVEFIDIKNPPWKSPQGALYSGCKGVKP